MGSSAGLNRVGARGGEVLLALNPTMTGTQLDSGAQMVEAIGFTKWFFELTGPGAATTGYTVTIYGTVDPAAYDYFFGKAADPYHNTAAVAAAGRGNQLLPATSWFALPGPSEQSGTGAMANPMVSGQSQIFICSLPLVAVRAVAVLNAPTANVNVLGFAVP